MTDVIVASAGTLLIFGAERLTIARVTRSAAGREWIRAHPLLHPNAISILRMPMGIVGILMWLAGYQLAAFLWFAFWMITDLTDGTIARACGLTTESGKWIDPLSDKFMYFPALLLLALHPPVKLPLEWVLVLIAVDTVGQLSRLFAQKKAANLFGKAKTCLITTLVVLASIDAMHDLPFIGKRFLAALTLVCAVLAFLSFYCKVVPDLWYANTFTLANFVCGVSAIVMVYHDRLLFAFVLVFLGQFFDLFDGRMARKYGSTRLGAVFDDIADGTSFGLATALIVLAALGPHPCAWAAAFFYCICVTYRLLRFLRRKGDVPAGVFEGLPSPAGALLAGSGVLVFEQVPWAACAVTMLTSLAMISRIHYRHFAHRIWPGLPNMLKIGLFVGAIVFVSRELTGRFLPLQLLNVERVAFAVAVVYLLFGLERPLWKRRTSG